MQIILIWLESTRAAHLLKKLKHCRLSTGEVSHQICDWQPTDWFWAHNTRVSSSSVSLAWAYITSMTFCCQPFGACMHIAFEGLCSKAACRSFRKLKLINTRCMNYITSAHMRSTLHKHTQTHLALISVDTNGESSPSNISFQASVCFLSICGQTWVTLFARSGGCLFNSPRGDRWEGFAIAQFLILGKVWITDGCIILILQAPPLAGLTFLSHTVFDRLKYESTIISSSLYCRFAWRVCLVFRTFVFVISKADAPFSTFLLPTIYTMKKLRHFCDPELLYYLKHYSQVITEPHPSLYLFRDVSSMLVKKAQQGVEVWVNWHVTQIELWSSCLVWNETS